MECQYFKTEDRKLETKTFPPPPRHPDANTLVGYALKGDIKHYFDSVDHQILISILKHRINDPDVIRLIIVVLKHHKTATEGKGMPLGNLTSQFFANVYLNELDYFVKHSLKVEYYIRYVDDFVILHRDRRILENWKNRISVFLQQRLELELHPEKSKVIPLRKGITLLGFRVFYQYMLLKKSNVRRVWKRLEIFKRKYDLDEMKREEIVQSLEGWFAYAKFANAYNLQRKVAAKFNDLFGSGVNR